MADAGYKIPYICKQILDDRRVPVLPYKRPMRKDGYFKPYEYVYDKYYDCVICPEYQVLHYATTNREGYREYKSRSYICEKCPFRSRCTNSKSCTKTVTRHVWQDDVEVAESLPFQFYSHFATYRFSLWKEPILRLMRRVGSSTIWGRSLLVNRPLNISLLIRNLQCLQIQNSTLNA